MKKKTIIDMIFKCANVEFVILMEVILKRSNNIPMAVLGYLTPKEKRAELELAVA